MPLGKALFKDEEAWWFYHTMTKEETVIDLKEFNKWIKKESHGT